MIRVMLPQPPAEYESRVKARGEAFLRRCPSPSQAEWRKHRYWQQVHTYLYNELQGICSYSASWTPRKNPPADTDQTSIDHYVPKAVDASQAYEWNNFRLCRSRLNQRKGKHRDVLDPCATGDDWFIINFTTFRIEPDPGCPPGRKAKVLATICRLELNQDRDYVYERIRVIRYYVQGHMALGDLVRKYPFIAQQMTKQDFDTRYKPRIAAFLNRAGGGGQ